MAFYKRISSFRHLLLGVLGMVWLMMASAGNSPVPPHAAVSVYHHILKDIGDEPRSDVQDDYSHLAKNGRSRVHQNVYRKRIIHAQSPAIVLAPVSILHRPGLGMWVSSISGFARIFIRPGYYVHLFRCAVF